MTSFSKKGNKNFDESKDYSRKSNSGKKSKKRSLSNTPRKSKRVSDFDLLDY